MISAIVPVYNESKILEKNITKLKNFLNGIGNYEIIIVDDGSTDGSDKIAKELSEKYHRIRHIRFDARCGKGISLTYAILNAKGDVVFFIDADLPVNLELLRKLIGLLNGFSIVITSRFMKDSKVTRSLVREILSYSYSAFVRVLFNCKIKDYQCGFKIFKKNDILPILREIKDRKWFWDTELILRSSNKGLKIKECAVNWKESRKENIPDIIESIFYLFFRLLIFRIYDDT